MTKKLSKESRQLYNKRIKKEKEQAHEQKKKEIVEAYLKILEGKYTVKVFDLQRHGFPFNIIKYYFGSLEKLANKIRLEYPELFYDVHLDDVFTSDKLIEFHKNLKNHKRFVITTAALGCFIDSSFLSSIENYCKRNDACLLVLIAEDPASAGGRFIDKELIRHNIVPYDTKLNDNFFISTIKLSTKQIKPTTGLARISQGNGSFIYASPKQFLEFIPTSNTKLPHAVMTTGAITHPNYSPEQSNKEHRYMSQRTAYIAKYDHVMGAVIVEIEDDNIYHFRQIQSFEDGSFITLGKKYFPNGQMKPAIPEGFIMGDWHSGQTDPTAKQAWQEVCEETKPKRVFVHDGLNGLSINHHEQHKKLLKAKRSLNGTSSLENEIKTYADDLNALSKWAKELVVVHSNHDDFLMRYLDEGMYVDDPQNHYFALKLALGAFEGKYPVKYAVELKGLKAKNIRWLDYNDDFKLSGVVTGAHGHKGPNGARGSIISMERAYGDVISAHDHTPGILRKSWKVGTTSLLKMGYNDDSPSSWFHTSCLLYEGGARELINSINGKWKL